MKALRRLIAAITVALLAFRAIGSFLSWVEKQDETETDAWRDEELALIERLADELPGLEIIKRLQRFQKRNGWKVRTDVAILLKLKRLKLVRLKLMRRMRRMRPKKHPL
jgi:hypothetical protein